MSAPEWFRVPLERIPETLFRGKGFQDKMPSDDNWLTMKRKEFGITQAQLAEALGVTDRTILNWERGHHEPRLSIRQVKIVCRLFQCSLEQLPDNFPFVDATNEKAEA